MTTAKTATTAKAAVKESKAKKAKSPPVKKPSLDHPKYIEMITDAIVTLKERSGSSVQAISKFVDEKYNYLPENYKKLLFVQLKKNVADGKLIKIKASYKLAPKTASSAPAKKRVGKKPKAEAPAKKKVVATPTKAKAPAKKKVVDTPTKTKAKVKAPASKAKAKLVVKAKPADKAKPAANVEPTDKLARSAPSTPYAYLWL